jgi:hypothetical protein
MLVSIPSAVEHRAVSASAHSFPSDDREVETVAWLLRWCPHQARALALAAHELAAWQYDDSHTEHWHRVLMLLPVN